MFWSAEVVQGVVHELRRRQIKDLNLKSTTQVGVTLLLLLLSSVPNIALQSANEDQSKMLLWKIYNFTFQP